MCVFTLHIGMFFFFFESRSTKPDLIYFTVGKKKTKQKKKGTFKSMIVTIFLAEEFY